MTNGHNDEIKELLSLFDEVVVTVAKNPSKTALFSVAERLEMLKECLKEFATVKVDTFDGLIVDHALKHSSAIGIIRGLRAVSDF